MIIALLANPGSGTGGAPNTERTLVELGAQVRSAGSEDELASAAEGADRIAVAGGDGSVAPAAAVAASLGLPLAVMPCGTANDFVRAMKLPRDVDAACELAFAGQRLRRLELCRMDGRPFVNVANGGLAAAAARHATPLKRRLGHAAYKVGAARAGLFEPAFECVVDCDGGRVFDGTAWQVTIASSGAFGAGSEIGPANSTDGVLDVAIVPGGPRARLIQRAWGMRSGRLTDQDDVIHARARTVHVEGELDYNVDGEIVHGSSVGFTVEPSAFALVCG